MSNLKFKEMKKSVKTNMDEQKYKTFVGVAIWTVFRCFKTSQWAYNLQDVDGNKFWDMVKEGKGFQYKDEQVSIRCEVFPEGISAELVSQVLFKDGVREVIEDKKSSVAIDTVPSKKEWSAPKVEKLEETDPKVKSLPKEKKVKASKTAKVSKPKAEKKSAVKKTAAKKPAAKKSAPKKSTSKLKKAASKSKKVVK